MEEVTLKPINRKIQRLAIANRGEVAVRIIRACQELGIETVLLHSEPDVATLAYRLADRHICIGPAPTAQSYLNISANVQGALAQGAQAVHPGFGFLSENADFAEACAKAGLLFIGPSPEAIRRLGDKVQAKAIARKLGLPLVPGYEGDDQSILRLVQAAETIGYPVIVKAAAGGGGRGMKVLTDSSSAKELIESAQREALSAFGSAQVFLEKYLDRAKHIEMQIFGDASGRVRHLWDRECSVQRRHQKMIEEALSPSLTSDLRLQMGQAACWLGEEVGYQGAGTVEFLLQDGKFYFLEVNTRLQVEHPVTELVMGVDLVKAQILTAQGQAVFPDSENLAPRGHAIECRIYAEDPYQGGIPSIGKIIEIKWPEGPGRRFECGLEAGDEVTSFYDSMIAKVIVWDESRVRAMQKMQRVLADSIIFGVRTNIPLLQKVLAHPEFVTGRMTTRMMGQYFADSLPLPEVDPELLAIFEQANAKLQSLVSGQGPIGRGQANPFQSQWRGV